MSDWSCLPFGFFQRIQTAEARLVCRSWARNAAASVAELSVRGLPPRDGIFAAFPSVSVLTWEFAYPGSLPVAGPLSNLTKLVLDGCEDGVVLELCDLSPPRLRVLDLSWNDELTNNALTGLRQLSGLVELSLKACEGVDSCVLENTALESLDMGGMKNLEDTRGISGLTSLTSLKLTYCYSLKCIAGLRGLTRMRALSLKCTAVRDVGAVGELASLTSLNLSGCRKLGSFGSIGSLSRLAKLKLHETGLSVDMGREVGRLGAHGSLTTLDVGGHTGPRPAVTDESLREIGKIGSLTSLCLELCHMITDAGMAHLGRLTSLETLDIVQCSNVTDAGVRELGRLKSLRELNARLCGVTPSAREHLSHIADLSFQI